LESSNPTQVSALGIEGNVLDVKAFDSSSFDELKEDGPIVL
jgi:hypothetical protein